MYQINANSTVNISKLNNKLSDMKALMHQMLKKLKITKNSSDL